MTLAEARDALLVLQNDPAMRTEGRYSPTATDWPDNVLPFIEIHMAYLKSHKNVNPEGYISNLKLMIKNR